LIYSISILLLFSSLLSARVDTYLKLVYDLTAEGRLRQAVGICEKAIKAMSADTQWSHWFRMYMANLYIRLGEFDAAEKVLQAATDATSNRTKKIEAQRQLIRLYALQRKLETVVTQASGLPEEFYKELGDYYRCHNRFEKALAAYERLSEEKIISLPFAGKKEYLIRCHAALGNHETAVRIFEEILISRRRFQGSKHWRTPSGSGYFMRVYRGQEEEYEKFFSIYSDVGLFSVTPALEARLEKDPDEINWLTFMGQFYFTSWQFDKAVAIYERLVRLQPVEVRNLYWLAASQNMAGRTEEAKITLERANQLLRGLTSVPNDDYPAFYVYIASVCQKGRLYDAAIDIYRKALNAPGEVRIRTQFFCLQELAKLYFITGRYDKAAEIYERIIRSKDQIIGGQRMAWRTALKYGNLYEEVMERQRRKLESDPWDVDALIFLAEAYMDKGKFDKAIETLKKALKLDPKSAYLYAELGEAYLRNGRFAEAKRIYRRMLRIAKDRRTYRERMISDCRMAGRLEDARDLLFELFTSLREPRFAHEREEIVAELSAICELTGKADMLIASLEPYIAEHEDDRLALKLLADLHRIGGDPRKSEELYTRWASLEKEAYEKGKKRYGMRTLAEELMNKKTQLDFALWLAKRYAEAEPLEIYHQEGLIEAYIAAGRYPEAAKAIRRREEIFGSNYDKVFTFPPRNPHLDTRLIEAAKSPGDGAAFEEFCFDLIRDFPEDTPIWVNAHLALSTYYRSIGDEKRAEEHWQKTGLIKPSRWYIVGPFENMGNAGLHFVYPPEAEYRSTGEIDTDAVYDGFGGQIRWHRLKSDRPSNKIDLSYLKPNKWAVAYAYTTVDSPADREMRLLLSSGCDIKVWLNGREVFAKEYQWGGEAFDKYIVPVKLKSGQNSILIKIADRDWGFNFRLRIELLDS
jgi:tetratricopeptide (TPR) repeat protein